MSIKQMLEQYKRQKLKGEISPERSPNYNNKTQSRLLRRRSTFVVEEDENGDLEFHQDQKALLSSTLHTGGIKSILEKANKDFVFPEEVKSYISAHFRMIKEENESLRVSLEQKTSQLDKLAKEHHKCKRVRHDLDEVSHELKQTVVQLDKEKAKTKMMARQLKTSENSDDNVIFVGKEVYPSPSSPQKPDLSNNLTDVSKLRQEISTLKEVLRRELGSEKAAKEAIEGKSTSTWKGREEQIKNLEKSLASLKKLLDVKEKRTHSSGSDYSSTKDEYRVRCKVAEVERDRLNEYMKVLNERVLKCEENESRVEEKLREERRKTANLEHLLEKAHVDLRDSTGGQLSNSQSSQSLLRMDANASDDLKAMSHELAAVRAELEASRQLREEDRERFVKISSENKKLMLEGIKKLRDHYVN